MGRRRGYFRGCAGQCVHRIYPGGEGGQSHRSLARTMTTEATVLRAGEKQRISSAEVVPGDIVLLQSGDKVPADMRLFQTRDLQVDESALTGESVPVDKKPDVLDHDTGLADRRNMAYASTLVTYGQGTGIVVAIGDKTEVGRISQLISSTEALETPLTRKIARFSHILLYAILALAATTFVAGLIRGQSVFDMFMAAVALAVGAIPEGLPAAMTITLAIGVSRMARRAGHNPKAHGSGDPRQHNGHLLRQDRYADREPDDRAGDTWPAASDLKSPAQATRPQAGFSSKGLRWMPPGPRH